MALSWFFEDEESAYADSLFEALDSSEAVVPGIWPLEVSNALVMAERRGRISVAQSDAFLKSLTALPIAVSAVSQPSIFHEALAPARNHRLTFYDASYLGLAAQDGLPRATIDDKLHQAASAIGIQVFQPARVS